MARKRLKPFTYPKGILTDPNDSVSASAILEELARVLSVDVPRSHKDFWERLAMRLMARHVPVFTARRRPGKPKTKPSAHEKFTFRFANAFRRTKDQTKALSAIAKEDKTTVEAVRGRLRRARAADGLSYLAQVARTFGKKSP